MKAELARKSPTEKAFTAQILAFAKLHGWRSAHFRPAETKRGWRTAVSGDGKGFPDLVLARGAGGKGRVLFVELKAERGKASDAQEVWATVLTSIGGTVEYYRWRPSDWKEIERVLSNL